MVKSRRRNRLISLVLCAAMLVSMAILGHTGAAAAAPPVPSLLNVQKVENLPDDFMNGVDISSVLSLEESGVKFYDKMGQESDLFKILADSGVNYVRIRIWNDPWDAQGRGYGGGNCDVPRAAIMAKRATDAGMKVLLNFHYSDFWADPKKQMVPKAWTGYTVEQKAEAIYTFTKQSVQYIIDQGSNVGMVQIGNETNGSICGVSTSGAGGQANFCTLIKAGAKAVREIDPNILVAVHISDPQRAGAYADFSKMLYDNNVDYDVFGSSYYPFWHSTIANLTTLLKQIADTYGKKVAVFETSYMYTSNNGDGWNNTASAVAPYTPASLQTQAKVIRDVIQGVVDVGPKGVGVFVWEPAWIPVGPNNRTLNAPIWEKYGSGWAASYAAEYDPVDAGQWYGGCDCEHRAFFDFSGKPLPTMDIFNLVRTGTTAYTVSSVPAASATVVAGKVKLPATVNVVCSDGVTRPFLATWTQSQVNAAIAAGPGTYTISGYAGRYNGAIVTGANTDRIGAGTAATLNLTILTAPTITFTKDAAVITKAVMNDEFTVTVECASAVQNIALANENGMPVTLKNLTGTAEGGKKTFTAKLNLGTVGMRNLKVALDWGEGWFDSGVVGAIEITKTSEAPLVKEVLAPSGKILVNVVSHYTVTTNAEGSYSANIRSAGATSDLGKTVVSKTMNADGTCTWVLGIKIGTAGKRSLEAYAGNATGTRSIACPFQVTVTLV